MNLILVAPELALCDAWRTHFADLPNVAIVQGFFEELPAFDCMVSAANGYGFMDGGVDAAIVRYFGTRLQDRVRERIRDEFLGEQPVGTSILVETGDAEHPWLAHTPTMRLPMPVARTDYAYIAMRALLLAVRAHNRSASDRKIETIACPGLCTGTGRMPPAEAARQMALAYRTVIAPPARTDWKSASAHQDALGRGGDFALAPRRLV